MTREPTDVELERRLRAQYARLPDPPSDLPRRITDAARVTPSRGRARPAWPGFALAAAVLVFAALVALPMLTRPSQVGGGPSRSSDPTEGVGRPTATATPATTAAPPGTTPPVATPTSAPPTATPLATPDARPIARPVDVPLGETGSMRVDVRDGSGRLQVARPATPEELTDLEPLPEGTSTVMPLRGDGASVVLHWVGGPCDIEADLEIDRAGRSISLRGGLVPGCDTIAVSRGLVLTFASAVDTGGIDVTYVPSQLVEATDRSVAERRARDAYAALAVVTGVRLTRAADVDARLEPADRIVWSVSLENPVASGYCPSPEFAADPCPGAPAVTIFLDAVSGTRLGVDYQSEPTGIERSADAIPLVTGAANSSGGGDALLEGATLNGDEALGCVWVEGADGARTAVVWPFGFQAFGNPLRIVGPDGQLVAQQGDVLAIGGGSAPAGFAIPPELDPCGTGELWSASEVVSVNGTPVRVGGGSLRLETLADDVEVCSVAPAEPLGDVMLVKWDGRLRLHKLGSAEVGSPDAVYLDPVWPAGFSARQADRIEIFDGTGASVMRLGDGRSDLAGFFSANTPGVTICAIGGRGF